MKRARLWSLVLASALTTLWSVAVLAQSVQTPGAPAAPSTPAPAAPAPAPTPAPATPTQGSPAPAPAPSPSASPAPSPAPATPDQGAAAPDKQPPDTSISQTLELPPHPAVILTGKSTWDEGFKTIMASFAKLNDALAQNKITAAGKPLAVFTETDDSGFTFSAEIPIDKAPEGKTELSPDVKIGETPSGKAMRFQHRGSYEEIDSTYEAITAYLDEKGLEARNLFAEEYLDEVKTPDDSNLEVDIYVFLK